MRKPPRRNATAPASQAEDKKVALLTRKLKNALEQHKAACKRETEALERETATSQVLGIISRSPSDLQPVFETILASATRICEAKFGTLYLHEGGAFRVAAMHNARRHMPRIGSASRCFVPIQIARLAKSPSRNRWRISRTSG